VRSDRLVTSSGLAVLVLAGLCACAPAGPVKTNIDPAPAKAAPLSTAKPFPARANLIFASIDGDDPNVSASGYVTGVIEDGGTCTFTFEHQTQTLVASSTARTDASDTSCGMIQLPLSQFAPGTWSVRLQYKSSHAHASSDAMKLNIPQS
jgi:hypothetical protein